MRVRRQMRRLAASTAPRGVRLLAELVAQVRMLPLLALSVVLASQWLALPPRLKELANDAMVIPSMVGSAAALEGIGQRRDGHSFNGWLCRRA